MHICIVGSGTSSWLVVNYYKELAFVEKITVVGSPKIPHIGVGESTTLSLSKAHSIFKIDHADFIKESHAAVKYGVYYKNWSKKDWIHFFKSNAPLERSGLSLIEYALLLGNKDPETFIHDIYGSLIWEEAVGKNNIFPDSIKEAINVEHPNAFHFDAACYIEFLKKQALINPKVEFISDTVEHVNFEDYDYISSIILESKKEIKADYFINTTGQNLKTKNVFNEQYESLGNTLLTTKAVVYPLYYTNKREQFHPYTVAKTMKHGWRWITPTWERIGTGYAFSDNHISVDEAINEFITDVGDKSIIPNVVDFRPRVNKQTFKINSCSIGMANGFLEPLDAPGLALTNTCIEILEKILNKYHLSLKNKSMQYDKSYIRTLVNANQSIKRNYKFWTTFILNQYKTCHRLDTSFWVDQKEVKFEDWTLAIKDLNEYSNECDIIMLAQTLAARDIQFSTPLPKHIKPPKLSEFLPRTQHHLDYIESFHK